MGDVMELELWRYSSDNDSTLGLLMRRGYTWECLCFTLEDDWDAVKTPGQTRIPAGVYPLKLRIEGGMNARYKARYQDKHRGMIWLQDVPGFEWVYLHTGNTELHTEGCILVGETRIESTRTIGQSRDAYRRIYGRIATAIEAGGAVLAIRDLDLAVLPTPLPVLERE